MLPHETQSQLKPRAVRATSLPMEVLLDALQLLIVLLGVLKAYFKLRGSGKEDDHPNARDDNHRSKHLRG